MPEEYVERRSVSLAIQVKDDNIADIQRWLRRVNIQYSYDEIKSGGQLIVYTYRGPAIATTGWWIVLTDGSPNVMDDKTFNRSFERRSL